MIDIGVYDAAIAPDGCVGYNGDNQGITAGCQDTYGRNLQCQWIDITGVPDGIYDLVLTTNPEQEIEELNYDNNSATVRIILAAGEVRVVAEELRCEDGRDDGDGLVDCDDPDCELICELPPRLPALACPNEELQGALGSAVASGPEQPLSDVRDGGCTGQGRGEVGYLWTAPGMAGTCFTLLGRLPVWPVSSGRV